MIGWARRRDRAEAALRAALSAKPVAMANWDSAGAQAREAHVHWLARAVLPSTRRERLELLTYFWLEPTRRWWVHSVGMGGVSGLPR
jgi:hypothetical protein